jgi:hypothetical protein
MAASFFVPPTPISNSCLKVIIFVSRIRQTENSLARLPQQGGKKTKARGSEFGALGVGEGAVLNAFETRGLLFVG